MSAKKRLPVIFAVMLLTSVILTMGVSAAMTDEGGGFSLWDLLDGVGGFFRDLINSIGGFISNVISAIKNGVNAILGAFQKLISAIGDAINYLLSGLKALFIPSRESFEDFRNDILTMFDKKFGSVFSVLDYLGTRFKGLSAKKDLQEIFKVSFPKNSFLSGLSVDFLMVAAPVLSFFRFCVTGICCLVTALTCYNKVIEMVNT